MKVQEGYNQWAEQYDTNENKTRDLEAIVLRSSLKNYDINTCLEIGCGTGKNTEWLVSKCKKVVAVDFSEEMLLKAKQKINFLSVEFIQADITKDWNFIRDKVDLITFSLVLEHIADLEHIFSCANSILNSGGLIYIGELHPFKQYAGSKARFESASGVQVLDCYTHHISDFIQSAKNCGLLLSELQEYFDDQEKTSIPRILNLFFMKL